MKLGTVEPKKLRREVSACRGLSQFRSVPTRQNYGTDENKGVKCTVWGLSLLFRDNLYINHTQVNQTDETEGFNTISLSY